MLINYVLFAILYRIRFEIGFGVFFGRGGGQKFTTVSEQIQASNEQSECIDFHEIIGC